MTHLEEKKSEFMGQFRITPSERARIREMLRFYRCDRQTMARAVMEALFYHHANHDELAFPIRFVLAPKNSSGHLQVDDARQDLGAKETAE